MMGISERNRACSVRTSSAMTRADHRSSDLRGRSFADAILDGADFSGADLRGADLARARLRNADFAGARLGLRPLVGVALFAAAIGIVASTGWLIGWTLRDLVDGFGSAEWEEVFGRVLAMLVVGFFIVCVIAFGLMRALKFTAVAFVVGLALNYIVLGLTSQDFDLGRDGRVIVVLVLLGTAMIAGGIARVVGGSFATWAVIIVGLTGGFAAGQGGGGVAGVAVSMLLVILAKRALGNDDRDTFVRRLVHGLVARRGTRFTGADLTGADFSGTQLAQCDLTGATLDGTNLNETVGWPAYLPRP